MQNLLESLKQDLLRAMEILKGISRKQERVYAVALDAYVRGLDLSDVAPDELGCANALSNIIRDALPELNFPKFVSTRAMYDYFEKSPSFIPTDDEDFSIIIISPTEGANIGHVGILGKRNNPDGSRYIMSNNSFTGQWDVTHSMKTWKRYYQEKKGLPVFMYQIV